MISIFTVTATLLIILLTGLVISLTQLYGRKKNSFQKEMMEIKKGYENSLLQTQLEIREQTLLAVSREIHDHISHSLILSKLQLNTLNTPEAVPFRDTIKGSIHLINEAIQALRDISRSLNCDIIKEYGLLQAIENEIGRLEKTKLFKVTLDITGLPVYLDAKKEQIVFRIVQEAINNILKHAHAKTIQISISYLPAALELSVRDDGIGFAAPIHKKVNARLGSGLTNIRQRVSMIDGQYEITSTPGCGTVVKLIIPLFNPKQ